jgi:hypothetical protein
MMEKRLAKEGVKSHKERVEEYNKYLASLSEHHDMYVASLDVLEEGGVLIRGIGRGLDRANFCLLLRLRVVGGEGWWMVFDIYKNAWFLVTV